MLSVLRACRRLLRPGGRTAFFTVHVTPGLSKRDHRRAVLAGPRAVASDRDQPSLLRAAGLEDVEENEVTAEFLITVQAWLRVSGEIEEEVKPLQRAKGFDDE